ncbi:aminopeptidase P family protein [Actinacidiphila acididurans]|uniref:Aminopeptidase P family protein n=1 Tax=Actinacidiphila acididurans TaxID=2784346 RepID=A0ABS2U5F9_9ACTN|nr:aminopeptidase P family protein [Actinacidiphila acididurans]MBM9509750.1 aminopeptidase P family protein [Actinacidiphila acididurans]
MAEVHATRRERLRERCAATGVAAALVTRPANVRYLTGAAPPGAALLVGPGAEDVLVHLRPPPDDGEGGPDDLRSVVLPSPEGDAAVAAADLARERQADSLAVEEHHLTVTRHRAVSSVTEGLPLTDLGAAVEQLRLIKDEHEIAALRIAAEIADTALGELLESILVGRTERHLALELERRLVDHGADGPAFRTSVGTGPHSGTARHVPTDRRVEEGDFLTVRLGACYRGYRCEVGRTFVIGTAPAAWQIELYELVFDAQRAGRERLAPGVACRDVDRATRQPLTAAGHTEGLAPWTGHGVGLEIDEDPQLSPAAMGKLDACVPVTVEPGVHLPGRGGVRIDDTLVVRPTADGGPELLTITTKELLAL